MKFTAAFITLVFIVNICSAFIIHETKPSLRLLPRRLSSMVLDPEPEGGEELTGSASIPGCRVKKMESLPKMKSDDGVAAKFWMTAQVDGALIKEIRAQILKDASKKANFPGFRKGQVPPYAQPQITNFSFQESIIKTVESVMEAYGMKSLPGSDGNLNVNEDVKEMCKGYKIGEPIKFTATLNAVLLPRTIEDEKAIAQETEDETATIENE